MNKFQPDFLIIGAQKSGTTSLADALSRHSKVFVCEPMEPEYFSGKASPRSISMSESDYGKLYEKAPVGALCGEASTGTMLSEVVIPYIEKEAPQATLIALLRVPEKRAYSAYAHDCKKGRVKVAEQGQIFEQEAERYLQGKTSQFDWFSRSEYGRQLEPWVEHFGERLKIVIFEELIEDESKGFSQLQDFLGLPQEELSLTRENRSQVPRSVGAQNLIHWGRQVVGPLRSLLSERAYRRFRESLMAKLGKVPPGLNPSLGRRLRNERYCHDIVKLEQIIGREIPLWKI